MFSCMASERKSELLQAERELQYLKQEIRLLKDWCAADSPAIGFAMLHLERDKNTPNDSVDVFRDKLRTGLFTFSNFKDM